MAIEWPCAVCGELVNVNRHAGNYKRVTGWVRMSRGGAGGINTIAVREDLPEYAHAACVDMLRKGNVVGQRSLLKERRDE